jgi:hypothetical protein
MIISHNGERRPERREGGPRFNFPRGNRGYEKLRNDHHKHGQILKARTDISDIAYRISIQLESPAGTFEADQEDDARM